MDMIFVLVGFAVFCALAGVYVAVCHQRGEHPQDRDLGPGQCDGPLTRLGAGNRVENLKRQPIAGRVVRLALLIACAAMLERWGNAQEVIHATSGTIVNANASSNSFSLKAWDGSIIAFHAAGIAAKPVTFDKGVMAQTVAATGQQAKGARVLVFYYGYDALPTAVAIKDLGQGDIRATTGTVEEFDRRHRELTVASPGAAPTHIMLTGHAVVNTPGGVIDINKYHPHKGERLDVVFSTAAGVSSAVFIEATGSDGNLI
jgi:hypothetical protein